MGAKALTPRLLARYHGVSGFRTSRGELLILQDVARFCVTPQIVKAAGVLRRIFRMQQTQQTKQQTQQTEQTEQQTQQTKQQTQQQTEQTEQQTQQTEQQTRPISLSGVPFHVRAILVVQQTLLASSTRQQFLA